MKKFVAVAAMLAVASVNAEELKFGDVNYFLKAGQFNIAADVSSTYERFQNAGTKTETRGTLLESRFAYGLSDQLNLFIGLDYAHDRITKISGDKHTNNDGFANPAFGGNFRLMNQNNAAFNFDLGAIARINFEDAEQGSNGEDGTYNHVDPRSSLEVNARLGKKWNEANEWQLAGGVVYFKDGEYTVLAPAVADSDRDVDASMNLFVRATYQYRPVNEFMMSLSAQATRIGEIESEVTSTNTDITDEDHIDYDFVFRAKYLVTESFIANFHYGMSRNSDFDREIGTTDTEINRRRENYFGVGVDFLF